MKAALRTQLRTTRDGPKRCGPRNLSNDHRDVDRSDTRTCETAYCNGPPNVSYSQIRPWCSIDVDGGLSPDSFRAGPAMEGMGPGCVNTTIPVSMCAVRNCFPLCKRDGVCPRFARLNRHNHLSEVLAFNTPDEYLGREILEGIRILQSLLSPRRLWGNPSSPASFPHPSGPT